MNDNEILQRIEELVNEEHDLFKRSEHGQLEGDQHERLRSLQVNLDQCWDLLRQRRARREFGENPGEAKVRDASVVENYKQ
ncbi:MAG TPA: DUF2630 family protein [Ktedonobacterales bacterium]